MKAFSLAVVSLTLGVSKVGAWQEGQLVLGLLRVDGAVAPTVVLGEDVVRRVEGPASPDDFVWRILRWYVTNSAGEDRAVQVISSEPAGDGPYSGYDDWHLLTDHPAEIEYPGEITGPGYPVPRLGPAASSRVDFQLFDSHACAGSYLDYRCVASDPPPSLLELVTVDLSAAIAEQAASGSGGECQLGRYHGASLRAPFIESWYSAALGESTVHRVSVFQAYAGQRVLPDHCQQGIPLWSGWIIDTGATPKLIRETATLGDLDGKGRARLRPLATFRHVDRTFIFGEWGHWESVSPSLHSFDDGEVSAVLDP